MTKEFRLIKEELDEYGYVWQELVEIMPDGSPGYIWYVPGARNPWAEQERDVKDKDENK